MENELLKKIYDQNERERLREQDWLLKGMPGDVAVEWREAFRNEFAKQVGMVVSLEDVPAPRHNQGTKTGHVTFTKSDTEQSSYVQVQFSEDSRSGFMWVGILACNGFMIKKFAPDQLREAVDHALA